MMDSIKRMNIVIILLLVMIFNISEAGQIMRGPPSILPQCVDKRDPSDNRIMGPSTRARECTRQYCASDEYVIKIKQYAMSIPQSNRDAMDALTCITRKEQDLRE
jgi:hypothetical protein